MEIYTSILIKVLFTTVTAHYAIHPVYYPFIVPVGAVEPCFTVGLLSESVGWKVIV